MLGMTPRLPGLCPEQGVQCAPAPARILPRSKLSDGLLIDLILGKFRDHLPIYRQCARLWADAGGRGSTRGTTG